MARWVGVAMASLVGFVVGALIGGPYLAVAHGPILAILAGRAADRRLRRWAPGRADHSFLPSALPAVLELVAFGAAVFVMVLLWRDERATSMTDVVVVAAPMVTLVPLMWRLTARSVHAWVVDLGVGAAVLACGIATYVIGGLGYLVPASLLGAAAATDVLGSREPGRFTDPGLTDEIVRGQIPRWGFEQKLVVVVVTANVLLALVIGIGRVIGAPAGSNELVGDLGFMAAHSIPAVLGWWSLDGRPGLLLAAGITAFLQSGQGWWMLLSALALDPAPGTLGFLFVIPAAGYLVAYSRQRRAGSPRSSIVSGVLAGAIGTAAAVSLGAVRDTGCGPHGCTDDFMSSGEGTAALVLTALALAGAWILGAQEAEA